MVRRRGVVDLRAPVDRMFLCYLPGGLDKRLLDCGCQYSGASSHIGGLPGPAEPQPTLRCAKGKALGQSGPF